MVLADAAIEDGCSCKHVGSSMNAECTTDLKGPRIDPDFAQPGEPSHLIPMCADVICASRAFTASLSVSDETFNFILCWKKTL